MIVEDTDVGNFLSDFAWKRRGKHYIHLGSSYVDSDDNTVGACIEADCDTEPSQYYPLAYPKYFSTMDVPETVSGIDSPVGTVSLGDPNAFTKFAQLVKPIPLPQPESRRKYTVPITGVLRSEEETLNWLSSFGLPYDQAPNMAPIHVGGHLWPGSNPIWDSELQKKAGPFVISLSEFINCSLRAHLALDLWNLIIKEDWVTLRTRIGGNKNQDTALRAYITLCNIIESHLKNVAIVPRVIPSKKGLYKIEQYHRPQDLLGALWVQFLSVVVKPSSLVECKECGLLFVPNEAGQQFCPPPQGTMKSPCLNRHSVKRSRQKEKASKLFREGKSIDEIIRTISAGKGGVIAGEDVVNWIAEFEKNRNGRKKSRQAKRGGSKHGKRSS